MESQVTKPSQPQSSGASERWQHLLQRYGTPTIAAAGALLVLWAWAGLSLYALLGFSLRITPVLSIAVLGRWLAHRWLGW